MRHHHQHPNRRAPQRQPVAAIPNTYEQRSTQTLEARDFILPRATPTESSSCAPDDTSPRCEKPITNSTMTLPIVLGIAIPVVGALVILIVLHQRHLRKLKAEDRMDKTKSMDFGMEYPSTGGKKSRGLGGAGNSSGRHKNQLSLDMDVAAPYLLPPELQGSRESLHSMSKIYVVDDDKYKPSNSMNRLPYGNGSTAPSLAGQRSNRDSSLYTASIRQHEDSTESLTADLLGHSSKMATSAPPPARGASLPSNQKTVPELQVPEQAFDASRSHSNQNSRGPGLFPSETEGRDSYIDKDGGDLRRSHMHLLPHLDFDTPSELDSSKPSEKAAELSAQPAAQELQAQSVTQKPPQLKLDEKASTPFEGLNFGTETDKDASLPQVVEPEPQQAQAPPQARMSTMGGLEVNYGGRLEPRRLSYGFRPLPPAAESGEDAEERAMRIRSFYKEYFDDANPGGLDYYAQAQEPVPPLPTHINNVDGYNNYPAERSTDYNQGYYEQDYSNGYNQEYGDYYQDNNNNNAGGYEDQYYDDTYANPQRPFAEPPTRRAMTPPPRAPPRFQQGPGPRPGSSASNRGPPPPRSYSSQSNRYNGPPSRGIRAPSSLRKNALPEEPLLILPTPHLLKEDAFASPIAFAPAPRSKEFRNGTESEVGSGKGGVKPYSPGIRAHTPLASAFDELSVLPTPHQLRKSGAFTGLDFAPPRKFKNEGGDNFSDTGSIRSNRTGLSAAHHSRTGAYRVSRLPQDVVPTTENMTNSLKPSWDMRNL
ncbi:hypothetical protein TWF679_011376 [Orbilia oligospora]|uniref:Uncharacterized protein n=1 Tax=Orbilia oligospora TaxID=2813651 RepID=A0A8H8UY79_ORBOL|nr:hypothetical protein TWF679_011376 [Orbilia oligospora]